MNQPIVFDEAELERTLRRAFEDPRFFNIPRGIIRFDYDTAHAWRVNIVRDKVPFNEYFHDSQSGSIENGLRRALLFRHELLSSFPMTSTWSPKRALDQSPEGRVHRITEKGKVNPYVFWRATWHDENYQRRTQNFSVQRYGDDEARRLALEAATRNHNPVPKRYAQPDLQLREQWRSVSRAEVEQKAAKNNYGGRRLHPRIEVNDSFPFAFEGERRAQLHIGIERDRGLRNTKVAQFLDAHGRLYCELCGFSFAGTYAFLTKDIIEVHHTVPLSSLSSATRVSVEDLVLLCSNCHTAVHQGDAVANLASARLQFGPR